MTNNKRILIIYTGGTIGMAKSTKGDYVPAPGMLVDLIKNSNSFKHPQVPDYDIIEHDPLIDSSNIKPVHWSIIANDIKTHYEHYDGFVILHGTDTLAYSACALSFILKGLNKPVIVTGAQIPVSQLRSDGLDNILDSLLIAALGANIREVCVYFNKQLFRGNRTKKISADQMSAFDSPNYPLLGTVNINVKINENALYQPTDTPSFKINQFDGLNIAVINIFPGIQSEFLQHLMETPLNGLVIRTYGAGNAPNDPQLLQILSDACDQGTIIVNCTSCTSGNVDMSTYATGRSLLEMGIASGFDMTEEAALTKLYYLFSLGLSSQEVRHHLQSNLRGELTRS